MWILLIWGVKIDYVLGRSADIIPKPGVSLQRLSWATCVKRQPVVAIEDNIYVALTQMDSGALIFLPACQTFDCFSWQPKNILLCIKGYDC